MTMQNFNQVGVFQSANELICLILIFCFFIIGTYLHTRIIKVTRKEKDMTWALDAANSCFMLIYFAQYTLISLITVFVEDLYMYTGKWFCHLSNFVSYYGTQYSNTHSLVIAVMKYFHIVWWTKVTDFGKEKFNTLFFWYNLLNPALMSLIHVAVTPDFFVVCYIHPHVERCLGEEKDGSTENGTHFKPKMHDLCNNIHPPLSGNNFEYVLFIVEKSTCWIQTIVHHLILWNILEALVYFLIFRFMHR